MDIEGLTDGRHGFHIHEHGDLSDGCESACAHFNPFNTQHGGLDSEERHEGDLGNIWSRNGRAKSSLRAVNLSLDHNSITNILGRMIIVHADPDDLGLGGLDENGNVVDEKKRAESLKTGNAGKRVGCGVIGSAKAPENDTIRRNARAMKVRHKANWWEEIDWLPMARQQAANLRTCALCGQPGHPKIQNIPTAIGSRAFCTEKHYTDYVGLEYKGEGFYTEAHQLNYDMYGYPLDGDKLDFMGGSWIVIESPTYRPNVKMTVNNDTIGWAKNNGFTESEQSPMVYELLEPPLKLINYIRDKLPKAYDVRQSGVSDFDKKRYGLMRNARARKVRHEGNEYWDSVYSANDRVKGKPEVYEKNNDGLLLQFLIDSNDGRYWLVQISEKYSGMRAWFGAEADIGDDKVARIYLTDFNPENHKGDFMVFDESNWKEKKVIGKDWIALHESWNNSNDPLKNDLADLIHEVISQPTNQAADPNTSWRKYQYLLSKDMDPNSRLGIMIKSVLNPTTRNPNLKEALETLDNKKDWPPDVDWTGEDEEDLWEVDWNPALKVLKVVADLGLDKYINMPLDKAIEKVEVKFKDDPSKKAKAIKALTKINKGMRFVQDKGWDLLRASPVRNNPIREKKDEQGHYFQYGKQKKYYFDEKSTQSRQAAYDRVKAQVAAIFASGYRPRKNARAAKVRHERKPRWYEHEHFKWRSGPDMTWSVPYEFPQWSKTPLLETRYDLPQRLGMSLYHWSDYELKEEDKYGMMIHRAEYSASHRRSGDYKFTLKQKKWMEENIPKYMKNVARYGGKAFREITKDEYDYLISLVPEYHHPFGNEEMELEKTNGITTPENIRKYLFGDEKSDSWSDVHKDRYLHHAKILDELGMTNEEQMAVFDEYESTKDL